MDFLTALFDREPEELRPLFLLLGCLLFLAAFLALIWWMFYAEGSDSQKESFSVDNSGSENPERWQPANTDSDTDGESGLEFKQGLTETNFASVSVAPSEAEIGQRAGELSRWREENGVSGSPQDDWLIAERELYRNASGVNESLDRRSAYETVAEQLQVDGISSQAGGELSKLGYTNATALAGMSASDRSKVGEWMAQRGIDCDLDQIQVPRSDISEFGYLFDSQPERVDDLTSINGIGGNTEKRLNEKGVHHFQQVADWDEIHARNFGEYLGFPGRVEREEWIPQAQRLAKMEAERASTAVEPEPPLPDDSSYEGLADQYAGEDVSLDPPLGVIFNQSANCRDDLREISGIGNVLSKKLNETGVYRFQQIADWNDYNVWSFNRIISFPGRIQRDEWIRQARELAPGSRCLDPGSARVSAEELDEIIVEEFSGEDVEIREPFGIVYKSAPSEQDNLQDIKGVGPVLEQKLHDFGVYRFKQIANWPEPAIDEFQEQLSFPDRIRRDDWVGQCVKMIEG